MDDTARPRTALLVIDTQVGFRHMWADAQGTVDRIARLVHRSRAARTPVIWVQDDATLPRFSVEWQMPAELVPAPGETRIFKRHWDAFTEPGLRAALNGISRVAIAGAHRDYCIRTTGLRAITEGFDVVIVGDAHTTGDAQIGGEVVSGAAIIGHTNLYFAGITYPGRTVTVADHDAVELL